MRSPRIIKKNYEFDRVYCQGKRCYGKWLSLFYVPRKDGGISRVGIAVSRKVRGAVKRNRVKRVLRAVFWYNLPRVKEGYDLILLGRRELPPGTYAKLEQDFLSLLTKSDLANGEEEA